MNSAGRVLFLARHLDSGGVTTHMMTLAQGLSERGWQVALASAGVVGDHHHGPGWFEENGVRHFRVPFAGPAQGPRLLARCAGSVLGLDKAIRTFRPTIMHVHWRSTSPFAALECSLRGLRFVSTLHLDGIPSQGVFKMGSRWGERVIAISGETRDYLISGFGVPEERIEVVYNGVDASRFRPPGEEERRAAKRALGLDLNAPVLSLIGRLEPVKGHRLLLRGAASLRARFPNLQLVFAGEGSEREELTRVAGMLGLSGCTHFVGYADSRSVLWSSDVMVLPSYQEGFPVTVVEAMLCGVPVVRTPAAGAADQVVDGVTGFIVPFDDAAALAGRAGMILADRALAARLAGAGLQRALERFSLERMVDEIERIYLESGGGPRAEVQR